MAGELLGKGSSGLGHAFMVFNASSQVWNGAAYVTFVQTDSSTYKVTATELDTSGLFKGNAPANAAKWFLCTLVTGEFSDPITDPLTIVDEGVISTGSGTDPWAVALPGGYTSGEAGYILGGNVVLASTQSFNNTGQTTPLPTLTPVAAISGTAPAATNPAIDGALLEYAINYPVAQTFAIANLVSTGWTQFVFTIKGSRTAADSAALVTVVLTNPGAGTDGLTLLNGAAPSGSTSASDGSLTVNETTPDTSVSLTLTARGHAIATGSYFWELTRYSGGSGTKYMVGQGDWYAVQSIRINPVAS